MMKRKQRLAAPFWALVLGLAVLLPLAGLSDRRDEAPAGRGLAASPRPTEPYREEVQRRDAVGRLPLSAEEFRNVDSMLRDSLTAIRRGHFEAAVWTADEILQVEPSNITALELQGSALLFLNERDRAKAVWRKALELDPENRAVSKLLERI